MKRVVVLLAALSLLGAGIAYAAGLGLNSAKLGGGTQALTKGTCTLTSTAATDTWVNEGNKTQANGGATTLSIQPNAGQRRYAFLRFDLSSCGLPTTAGADSATLSITMTQADKTNAIAVYPVYSSWDGTLTWNTAQALTVGGTATASFTATVTSFSLPVTADIDAALKDGGFYGWEFVDTSGGSGASAIASAENGTAARRPTLTIAYAR